MKTLVNMSNQTERSEGIAGTEAIVWLSVSLSMTVLLCLALTVVLLYIYITNEPIEEMSDKERYMKRVVDKRKAMFAAQQIRDANQELGNQSDFFVDDFKSDEDLSTKMLVMSPKSPKPGADNRIKVFFVDDEDLTEDN